MVVKRPIAKGDHSLFSWHWHNLENGLITKIWEGDAIFQHSMDRAGKQLAFITKIPDTDKYMLWYYHEGMASATPRVVDGMPGIDTSLQLDNDIVFNKDGQGVFFSLVPKKKIKPLNAGVQVDLWNYRDTVLREGQVHKARDNARRL